MVVESGLVWLWAHDPSAAVARPANRPHRTIPLRDQPWDRPRPPSPVRLPTVCWAGAGGLLIAAAAAVLRGIDIAVVGALLVGAAALALVAAFSTRRARVRRYRLQASPEIRGRRPVRTSVEGAGDSAASPALAETAGSATPNRSTTVQHLREREDAALDADATPTTADVTGFDIAGAALAHLAIPHRQSAPLDDIVGVWPAEQATLANIHQRLSGWLREWDWPTAAAEDILAAVGEAVANAITHAYPPDRPGSVYVYGWVFHDAHTDDGCRVGIAVTDRGRMGRWPRPLERRGMDAGYDSGRPGRNGRGLILISSVMAETHIQRSPTGTTLILISFPVFTRSRVRSASMPPRPRREDAYT